MLCVERVFVLFPIKCNTSNLIFIVFCILDIFTGGFSDEITATKVQKEEWGKREIWRGYGGVRSGFFLALAD